MNFELLEPLLVFIYRTHRFLKTKLLSEDDMNRYKLKTLFVKKAIKELKFNKSDDVMYRLEVCTESGILASTEIRTKCPLI